MKRVLLVDIGFVLSGYISKKLHSAGIAVQKTFGAEQVLSYMERVKPDCIIVDYTTDREGILSMFENKWARPSIKNIPSIVIADSLKKNDSGLFASYGVKNIVMKPVQADELLQNIGKLLKVQFTFDITQSSVECNMNGDILFVEIATGLNRDRIELLHYRIQELLALYEIKVVKVLILITHVTISFLDAVNLEYLLDNVLSIPNASKEYIKVLSTCEFVKEFLSSHPKYQGIQCSSSLQPLLETLSPNMENITDLITSQDYTKEKRVSSISTKLKLDKLENISVAVVDDDITVTDTMTVIFKTVKAKIQTYADAESFMKDYKNHKFNIIFLDVILPGMQGFKCLDRMKLMDNAPPVVVLSSLGGKENIVEAFEKGARQYLVKPIKSDMIIAKTMEILGVSL